MVAPKRQYLTRTEIHLDLWWTCDSFVGNNNIYTVSRLMALITVFEFIRNTFEDDFLMQTVIHVSSLQSELEISQRTWRWQSRYQSSITRLHDLKHA